MSESEKQEQANTRNALNTLSTWGQNPNIDGGENITFSLARQGWYPIDAFLAAGDCTIYTASGNRGILHGQAPGDTGEPVAYFLDLNSSPVNANQVNFVFTADLNTGLVTLSGPFPGLNSVLEFKLEFLKEFLSEGGRSLLFYSEHTSDNAGYVIDFTLISSS
jgi:hypothetical protein